MKEGGGSAGMILPEQVRVQQSTHLGSEPKKYCLRGKDSKLRNNKDKKPQHKKLRCHYCRTRDIGKKYTVCGNYPNCRCGFCSDCLKNVFGLNAELLTKGWVCIVCHGSCNCQRCKGKFLVKITTTPRLMMENNILPVNSILNTGNNVEEEKCELRKDDTKLNREKEAERNEMKRSQRSVNETLTKKKLMEENKEFNHLPLNSHIIYPIKYALPNTDPTSLPYYSPMVPRIAPMTPYFVVNPENQLYQPYLKLGCCAILQNPMSGQASIGYTMQMPQINHNTIIMETDSSKKLPSQNIQEKKNEISLQKGNT